MAARAPLGGRYVHIMRQGIVRRAAATPGVLALLVAASAPLAQPRVYDATFAWRVWAVAAQTGASARCGGAGSSTAIGSPGRTSPPATTIAITPALRTSPPS